MNSKMFIFWLSFVTKQERAKERETFLFIFVFEIILQQKKTTTTTTTSSKKQKMFFGAYFSLFRKFNKKKNS